MDRSHHQAVLGVLVLVGALGVIGLSYLTGAASGRGAGVLLFLLGVLTGGGVLLLGLRLRRARAVGAPAARAAVPGMPLGVGWALGLAGGASGGRPGSPGVLPPLEAADAGAGERDPADSRLEAILLVDLVQSTELIGRQGDRFFRDLLRRIEASFIPVAREQGSRFVGGHGDGFLFCFDGPKEALQALRAMYARIPNLNRLMPPGVEVAFRASLHVGETLADQRGNRIGLAVLKAVRLGSAMESLEGRGAGRNSAVVSAEALEALAGSGEVLVALGDVALRGFPGRYAVYRVDL